MNNPIKVGVLGVGALGYHHARLYAACETADLVGVYDLNEDRAREVAAEAGTEVFTDPHALAREVQAVSIAVPTNHHFDVGCAMLEMGKHLLLEKPITETVEQAHKLLALADEKGLIVQVGHVERFNPVIDYLEEKLNNPRFIESHRLSPYPPARPGMLPRGTEVSVVLDLMIHDIDMVLSLVKSDVVDLDAVGIPVLSPTEDIANARLKFANGCVANLTASRITPEPMRKIRVFQHDAYLSLDYMARTGEIYYKENGRITRGKVPVTDHNALMKELEHFVSSVAHHNQSGKCPDSKVAGIHGTRAMEVAERVIEAMREVNPLRQG